MSTKLSQNRLPIFTIFWLTEFFDFFVPSGSASSEMTTMAVPKVNAPKSPQIALYAKRTSPHTSNFSRREINIRCPALNFLAKLNPRHGAPMFWRKFENDMGFSTQNMFFFGTAETERRNNDFRNCDTKIWFYRVTISYSD